MGIPTFSPLINYFPDCSISPRPQADPSKSRSTSMSEDNKGIIHLQLLYDPIAGILNIKLIDAQDLQPRDFSGTADPYAKIRLLPDKANVWQTRIHKRTLNPSG